MLNFTKIDRANPVKRGVMERIKDFKEVYTEREFLFGMIKWWELASSEKISNNLHIKTDVEIKDIYINGKKI